MAEMYDDEFSFRSVLDDPECDRWPDACFLASMAFEHWRSPYVCEHLFAEGERKRQFMFQCAEHPDTIVCQPCFELHSVTEHATTEPHCMIPACSTPIIGLVRVELTIDAGWVMTEGATKARLASGISAVLGSLCQEHGSRHIFEWAQHVNALAADNVSWEQWIERSDA